MPRRSSRYRRSSRRSRRGRRHGPNPVLVITGAAVGVLVLGALTTAGVLYGRPLVDALAATGAAEDSPAPATPTGPQRPADVVAGVIVDPSGSNGGAPVARRDLADLARVVTRWPGPAPRRGKPADAVPGLDLIVRRVAANSFAASAEVAHIRIPGIPELPPQPESDTDVSAAAAYLDTVDAVRRDWRKAREAAAGAAAAIRAASVPSEDSEIAGAVSALSQVLADSSDKRRIVVISDVEQAGAEPEVDGSLDNTTITVFQRCDEGADRCQEAREGFTRLSRHLDGPRPTYVRIEALRSGLADALRKG